MLSLLLLFVVVVVVPVVVVVGVVVVVVVVVGVVVGVWWFRGARGPERPAGFTCGWALGEPLAALCPQKLRESRGGVSPNLVLLSFCSLCLPALFPLSIRSVGVFA